MVSAAATSSTTGRRHKGSSSTNSLQLVCCPVIRNGCCQHPVSSDRRVSKKFPREFPSELPSDLQRDFSMRRADRLFQIIQVLRREAGMGYILERGFDLPPLMLTPDEIEAAVLGAQWVIGNADPVLARAAEDLMAKIADTVPERLRPFVLEPASRARRDWRREPDRIDMARTRSQIHEGKKITLRYRDEHGRDSERTIWPIAVGYLEAVRLLAAWCELRRDFRSFRTDRVIDAVHLDEKYPERRDLLRARWRRSLVWEPPSDT